MKSVKCSQCSVSNNSKFCAYLPLITFNFTPTIYFALVSFLAKTGDPGLFTKIKDSVDAYWAASLKLKESGLFVSIGYDMEQMCETFLIFEDAFCLEDGLDENLRTALEFIAGREREWTYVYF